MSCFLRTVKNTVAALLCLPAILGLSTAFFFAGCASGGSSGTPAPVAPTLVFAPIATQTYGSAPFTVNATSASSGAVTYAVTSGPATISGNTVTLTGAGTVNLVANQAAAGNYTVATANTSFTVTPGVPALTFQSISGQTFGNAPFTVSATSASSGAVTYAVTSGPATISGSTVTLTGVGTVVLGASQVASGNYAAASASTSFTVASEVPNLTFAPIPAPTFGDPPFTVSATSASSGGVTYSVTSGPATIFGSTVTLTGVGTVVLGASQVASGNYAAATASTSVVVAQAGVSSGTARSGSQTITGGRLYMYAAGTSGYGTAATSLLNSNVLTNNPSNSGKDSNGNYYLITDSGGNFNLTNNYTCTAGSVVYLYLVGGSYGGVSNSAIGLLALLGSCPAAGDFAGTTPYVYLNEISTIAAAYAMSGFATDATHVSSSGTTLAKTDIQNAFASASNLESISGGSSLSITPAGNGTVPRQEIDTLANILAACVHSAGSSSTDCTALFSNAKSAGSAGITPTDTASAAIYIAHNPGVNTSALYNLSNVTGTPTYSPALTTQPNDFTIAITFSGGGISTCSSLAVDGLGNVWVANELNTISITKLTSNGAVVAGSPFTGGGIVTPNYPTSIAIDASENVWVGTLYGIAAEFRNGGTPLSGNSGFSDGKSSSSGTSSSIAIGNSGNVWMTNTDPDSLSRLTSSGAVVSGAPYTGGGLSYPNSVAIDASGDIWVADNGSAAGISGVSTFTSSGVAVSGSPYTGGGLNGPSGIAIDNLGNAWVSNLSGLYSSTGLPTGSVTKLTSGGSVASATPFTGGGLAFPWSIAIDGSGNEWLPNHGNNDHSGNSITELSNNGAAVSGTLGFTGGSLAVPTGIAIDGSGNVWVSNFGTGIGVTPTPSAIGNVTEFVGAATPVVTPLVANLIAPYSAPASKP